LQWWGIDIVSKLTPAQGNYTFAVVAVEHFTKWVEAKPITNMSLATIQKNLWQNFMCRYAVPQQIIVDNTKYFDSGMFKDFCHRVGMKDSFASVYHTKWSSGMS
jgi:hypothetical protein